MVSVFLKLTLDQQAIFFIVKDIFHYQQTTNTDSRKGKEAVYQVTLRLINLNYSY